MRLTPATLRDAVCDLCARDDALARLVLQYGEPPLWERAEGFVTLVRVILEQQVSLESAATLFARLDASVPGGMQPEPILTLGVDGLRALGQTRQKAAYLVALAQHVTDGRLDLQALPTLPDDEVLVALERVPGIGPWTAQVYLLFSLGRPDAWPPGDLALHKALKAAYELERVPSSREASALAAIWSPWRAVAARILWHAYLTQRGRSVP
ncbi:DNA-3-methyladenine glycosylase family protein [Gemmatimonas groenlandica]|uniref:DNA-3-methyladenine glycosylase II n=1 Tax=Gemmatimonas groenlandica TaxID=2732249 RepID=A0A6M4IR94_9BACT|nr:DNA-3-methyladenine glycosylase 2 family protein [Gemmatimonas groenlandica]QJR37263.1 DNA-3-methyladenine glycosylase 2 family protein [Gemmatimonas groenlandica]